MYLLKIIFFKNLFYDFNSLFMNLNYGNTKLNFLKNQGNFANAESFCSFAAPNKERRR